MESIIELMDKLHIQIALTVGLLIVGLTLRFFFIKVTNSYTIAHGYSESRQVYVRKVVHLLLYFVLLALAAIIWEVSLKGLSLYFVSFFTVVGVAFFASWSIISNITASIILFFNYPFKIGERIRIQDGDNSVEGKVVDINLFNIRILTEKDEEVSYPNNLALQKPIFNLTAKTQEDL